jgi:membrane protein
MHTLLRVLRGTWFEFRDDRCLQVAAALSYYVLFSVIPLVAFLVALFGLVLRDPSMRASALDTVLARLPLDGTRGQNLVIDAMRSVADVSATMSVIGLVGLLWGAMGLLGAVREALNVAWDTPNRSSFLRQRISDVLGVIALGVLLVASIVGTNLLHNLQLAVAEVRWNFGLATLLTWVGTLLPAGDGCRDVWVGALVATLLFELAKHAFAFYVAHFANYQVVYGALGAVLLFLLWTYVSSIVLLLGAELAATWQQVVCGAKAKPTPVQPREAA